MAAARSSRGSRYGLYVLVPGTVIVLGLLVAQYACGLQNSGWFVLVSMAVTFGIVIATMVAVIIGRRMDYREEDRKISRQMSP